MSPLVLPEAVGADRTPRRDAMETASLRRLSQLPLKAPNRYRGFELDSAFQPIYSLAHQRPVGYEALLRGRRRDGSPVSPGELFAGARSMRDAITLDRLARAVHARRFGAIGDDSAWLFLNISPQVVINGPEYGAFFERLLDAAGLQPGRVVVEILEKQIADEATLARAVDYYKQLGCLVAIDDFGAGHSNFSRIVGLEPDLVKLDRSLIQEAAENGVAARILPSLVTTLHQAGCLVVMEGIETEMEALLAMEANVDFVQGYYFNTPAPAATYATAPTFPFDKTCRRFHTWLRERERSREMELANYLTTFEHCTASYAAGADLDVAFFRMASKPRVQRCYVLDSDGVQRGGNHCARERDGTADPRFKPLYAVEGANWSRKPYFRTAVRNPGTTQVTAPYLSITGAELCVTLSRAISRDGNTWVVCADVAWN